MQIKNYTTFDTRKLRTLVTAVYRAVAEHKGDLPVWSRTIVEVSNSRKWYGGRAALSGLWTVLRIPTEEATVNLPRFIALTRHEIWHLYGIRHEDFPKNVMHSHSHTDTEFVRGVIKDLGPDFVVARNAPKTKPSKIDVLDKKLTSIAARLKAWETKRKRAENAIVKLVKEQKVVSKKIAASTLA